MYIKRQDERNLYNRNRRDNGEIKVEIEYTETGWILEVNGVGIGIVIIVLIITVVRLLTLK